MCVKTACIEESRILLQTQINSRKLSTVLVLEAWVLVLVHKGLGTCYISGKNSSDIRLNAVVFVG